MIAVSTETNWKRCWRLESEQRSHSGSPALFPTGSSWTRHDARSGIVEDERSLLRGLGGIDRDGDCAQGEGGEIGDGPLRTVLAENGDAVALTNSPGASARLRRRRYGKVSAEEMGIQPGTCVAA